MNLKKVVGMNLRYYRFKSNLSQEKFYQKLGLNHKYLANVERGKENISLEYVEELAQKLDIDVYDLLLFKEDHLITKRRIDQKNK